MAKNEMNGKPMEKGLLAWKANFTNVVSGENKELHELTLEELEAIEKAVQKRKQEVREVEFYRLKNQFMEAFNQLTKAFPWASCSTSFEDGDGCTVEVDLLGLLSDTKKLYWKN